MESGGFSGSKPGGDLPDMGARRSLEKEEGQRILDTFDARLPVRWAGHRFYLMQCWEWG